MEGGTRAWDTEDSRALAKRYAALIGLDADVFGGKCWRIGGATDLREVLGDSAAAQIKQRGRWESDVAAVYQRAIVDAQLQASAVVGDAEGEDMEAMCAGWAQPASLR
eukprot:3284318-Pleurochrysis_carterae.AAC.1